MIRKHFVASKTVWGLWAMQLVVIASSVGCEDGNSGDRRENSSSNTLTLGGERFSVSRCVIFGHIERLDGQWVCNWNVEADGATRTFSSDADATSYRVQPALTAYSLPLDVSRWRELDGATVKSNAQSSDGVADVNKRSARFNIRTTKSNEECSQNEIVLRFIDEDRFHVHWTGNSKLDGIDGTEFELDATAKLTGITLTGEAKAEDKASDKAIEQIFQSIFPHGDFEQLPADRHRFESDGASYTSFVASFRPRD